MKIRRILLPLHLIGGLISAVFLALLGASGALVAFENEIDHWLNGPLTWVQPQGAPLSLGEISSRVQQRHPESRVSSITLPADPRIAYGIHMRSKGKGKPSGFAVNPYTGEELGSLDTANTFTRKVHQFHTNLLLGPRGKIITTASAIILLGLSISGLILWMPAKLWKPGVLVRKNAGCYEWHNVMGFYASIFMLIFAGTGIVVHWDDETRAFVDRIAGHPDGSQEKHIPSLHRTLATLGPDELLAVAMKAVPGARATTIQSIGVSPVRITMKYPEDRTPAGRTNLYIDDSSGEIVSMATSRTAPIGTRVAKLWNREIHTGDIGGLPTRILACAASLSLPFLAITGPLMWVARLRRKRAAG